MSKEEDKKPKDSDSENKNPDLPKPEKPIKDHLKSEKIEDGQKSPSKFVR
jgi:hypothetical protein